MKRLFIGSIVFLSVSCVNKAGKVEDAVGPDTVRSTMTPYTDTAWFADLRAFSVAVSKGDRAAVKGWFRFPIIDTLNEIWVYTDTSEVPYRDHGAVPFTEKDFDARYDRLFTPELVKGLEKLKLDSIVPGMADDLELGGNDSVRYSLISYVDGAKTEFNLLLNSTYIPVVEGKRDEEEAMESSVGFIFDIRQGKKLVFRELRLAD